MSHEALTRGDLCVSPSLTVLGELEDRLDPRSFVLESGGIFDDEITVIVPRGVATRCLREPGPPLLPQPAQLIA